MAVRPEIVLFGDSITQQSFGAGGWGAAIANAHQRTADVKLRGYSGYNTRWALRVLPEIFPNSKSTGEVGTTPALVTVLFGANDANRPGPLKLQDEDASRQHVPVEEYGDNLRKIITAIRETGNGSARVLLITPPPVDEEAWHGFCVERFGVQADAELNRNFETTALYACQCKDIGREMGVPTLDLHSEMSKNMSDRWKSLLVDGLHPNEAGGEAIGKLVLNAIETHWPYLKQSWYGDKDPILLPMDYPDHKDIDHKNIDRSFEDHAKTKAKYRMG